MSLLLLKTKNLSWQDHTLNIEVMLAPLRSTLLMNKHKTMETKFEQAKSYLERQRVSCLKDYTVERRMIERRKNKINKRKKELFEDRRVRSVLEAEEEKEEEEDSTQAAGPERSFSAPTGNRDYGSRRSRGSRKNKENPAQNLPKLTLKQTPLFTNEPLRPRLFLETGGKSHGDSKSRTESSTTRSESIRSGKMPITLSKPHLVAPASPLTRADLQEAITPTPPRRHPAVTFLELLEERQDEEEEDVQVQEANIQVEVKVKSVEEKVREFNLEMEKFNSRPATACSSAGRGEESFVSSRRPTCSSRPANRYSALTLDRQLLEQSFDNYCRDNNNEELVKVRSAC